MEAMSDVPIAKKPTSEDSDSEEDFYYPHWKHQIDINLICDDSLYNVTAAIPSEISRGLRGKIDWQTATYEPIIYLSDFWLLKKDLRAMNDTLDG